MQDVLIVGGGIGGLTLALELSRRGIGCHVFESALEINAVGVGVNLLPHAMRAYSELGLQAALERVAVETKEAAFYNRFGQLIYREPLGRSSPSTAAICRWCCSRRSTSASGPTGCTWMRIALRSIRTRTRSR